MTGPEISPLLRRLSGERFRSALKDRLEELASETDDPAYASRLCLVAKGARPLRTLLHDPRWTQQFGESLVASSSPDTVTEEERAALDERVTSLQDTQPDVAVTPEQAQSDAAEIVHMADRTQSIIAQERLSGWGHVHELDPDQADRRGDGHGF